MFHIYLKLTLLEALLNSLSSQQLQEHKTVIISWLLLKILSWIHSAFRLKSPTLWHGLQDPVGRVWPHSISLNLSATLPSNNSPPAIKVLFLFSNKPKPVLPLGLWSTFLFCWGFVCFYINWSSEKIIIIVASVKASGLYKEPCDKLCIYVFRWCTNKQRSHVFRFMNRLIVNMGKFLKVRN